MNRIIKKPIMTEKSLKDTARNVFTFAVSRQATKTQIASVVESTYGVKVLSVRTSFRAGKTYRSRRLRQLYFRPAMKTARVVLSPGQKIDVFEIKQKEA